MVLPDQLKALSFLVVEDNAFTTMELCRVLRKLGAFNIETASEGREALRKMDDMDTQPSVLVVDLRMPGMGGTELLDRLAERNFRGHVIICSGVDPATLEAVEAQARAAGLNILPGIGKPFYEHDFSKILNDIVTPTVGRPGGADR